MRDAEQSESRYEPDLNGAIVDALGVVKSQYQAASAAVREGVRNRPSDAAAQRALALAQGQMTSALQQMAQLQSMISDERGRDGYDAAVTVMQDAGVAAASACTCIKTIVDAMNADLGNATQQQARNQALGALAEIVNALAKLAPTSLWQKAPAAPGS